jgi:hypothetical protein
MANCLLTVDDMIKLSRRVASVEGEGELKEDGLGVLNVSFVAQRKQLTIYSSLVIFPVLFGE